MRKTLSFSTSEVAKSEAGRLESKEEEGQVSIQNEVSVMWVEVNEGLFVYLKQVCAIRKNYYGTDHWYDFYLSNGEVVKSHKFENHEKAEKWFRDEVLPFLIQERRNSRKS